MMAIAEWIDGGATSDRVRKRWNERDARLVLRPSSSLMRLTRGREKPRYAVHHPDATAVATTTKVAAFFQNDTPRRSAKHHATL